MLNIKLYTLMPLLPRIYYDCKRFWKHQQEIEQDFLLQVQNNNGACHYYNWWVEGVCQKWLEDFISQRGLNPSRRKIALCSVFGEREVLNLVDADVRIFFSGENLHNPRHAQYAGYMLEGKRPFDLGIGFDYFDDERYIRFPLWMMYMFAPDSTEDDIRKKCELLRYPQIGQRDNFAALIARADWNGKRGELADTMSKYGEIKYPSAFRHNDETLKASFNDDKIAYLKQFKFNICPENTNAMGYVTEKIFESISAGCIPVYWGAYSNPEPEVLNLDAIIMDLDKCNLKDYDRISQLPRLKDGAEQYIINNFVKLEEKLKDLCQ